MLKATMVWCKPRTNKTKRAALKFQIARLASMICIRWVIPSLGFNRYSWLLKTGGGKNLAVVLRFISASGSSFCK
ncbi:hypothetical protein BRADI_1g74586v3 [Brachypodium distachyon]|uniref:Uncharacterized protein n=1 Tax=Brachypodium distachyon TaxID=15368 RepID=A0A2K2DV51_BRADI|nr:hypothetical protein BRADI_1g74586v3 [Brachypodium distachyon]